MIEAIIKANYENFMAHKAIEKKPEPKKAKKTYMELEKENSLLKRRNMKLEKENSLIAVLEKEIYLLKR